MVDENDSPQAPPARGAPHPRTTSEQFQRTNSRAGLAVIATLLAAFVIWMLLALVRNLDAPIGRNSVLLWVPLILVGVVLVIGLLSRKMTQGALPSSRGDRGA